jgi:hypothetical protein
MDVPPAAGPDTCLISAKILSADPNYLYNSHREDEQPRRGRKDSIMTDRFLELCAREFAAHVQRMFDNAPRIPGTGMAEIPIVGGLLLLGMPVPDCLYERVCMAMAAREQFHQDKPAWAPELPLHGNAIAAMKDDDRPQMQTVGLYADSLAAEYRWDYELHPPFAVFVSGLMAYPSTPDEIRSDHALQLEFPPCPLDGLCDGRLYWRSPAMLAFDLERQAARDAFMARERGDAPPSG